MYISKKGLTTNSLLGGKINFVPKSLIANSSTRNGNGKVEEEEEDMMNTTYSFCTQSFFPQP
jgi:hypothetical protein